VSYGTEGRRQDLGGCEMSDSTVVSRLLSRE
jgi:hypothetical protein